VSVLRLLMQMCCRVRTTASGVVFIATRRTYPGSLYCVAHDVAESSFGRDDVFS